MHSAKLHPENRKAYMLSGRAKVTIVSTRTGARFTYKIVRKELDHAERKSEKITLYFVSNLRGSNNETDYVFIGTIFSNGSFRRSDRDDPLKKSTKAFMWCWSHLESPLIEVWHSGVCGRCGRELTDPESIARGLGPTCADID